MRPPLNQETLSSRESLREHVFLRLPIGVVCSDACTKMKRGLLNVSALLAAAALAALAMLVVERAGATAQSARLQTDKLFRNRQRQNLMHSLVCATPRMGGSKLYTIHTKP